MTSNEQLRTIRHLTNDVLDSVGTGDPMEHARYLAVAVRQLDVALCEGASLPDAWTPTEELQRVVVHHPPYTWTQDAAKRRYVPVDDPSAPRPDEDKTCP